MAEVLKNIFQSTPFHIYLAAISVLGVIITCYDKHISQYAKSRKKRRIPEAQLLLLAALGGAVLMYITMKIIRHKTRHNKFMIGIPIIVICQIAIIAFM